MKKTTADVPPSVASEYKKAPRAQAVAEATGDGYTDTKNMKKAKRPPRASSACRSRRASTPHARQAG